MNIAMIALVVVAVLMVGAVFGWNLKGLLEPNTICKHCGKYLREGK